MRRHREAMAAKCWRCWRLLLRRKGTSSDEWLRRQHKDPYVERSKRQNYRCRSAFKLLEIDEKVNFLKPGHTVIDLGAAPGSWTQVAVKKVNADGSMADAPVGRVLSLDRQHIFPIRGATIFGSADFETEEAQARLRDALDGRKADAVISDMAPNSSGVRSLDRDRILGLVYKALRFAAGVSDRGACLLVKVWDGAEVPALEADLGRFYKTVKSIKPPASRDDSSEKFLFAKGFKGLHE